MKELIKQLESKVKNCHNTNTIFDTRNYVLLDDVRKIIADINYTHCCETLKDEEIPTFTDWLKDNGWKKTPSYYYYKKGGTTKERNLLIKMYQKEYYL